VAECCAALRALLKRCRHEIRSEDRHGGRSSPTRSSRRA
jgi:hypothetical protein